VTTQLIAILASAGLVTAGVAATSETRSASAIPAASMVSVTASKAKTSTVSSNVRRSSRPVCAAADVACLAQSGGQGVVGGGVGGGGGVSGGVLAAIAGGLGVSGIVIAAKGNDSKG